MKLARLAASAFFAVLLLPLPASADGHDLLDKARRDEPLRYDYAMQHGARIGFTDDGRTFYVLWYPEGFHPDDPPPMIATIHGHGSWAFDEFYLWHAAAAKRGFGVLALQWRVGEGEDTADYLTPDEIYKAIDDVFTEEDVAAGSVARPGQRRAADQPGTQVRPPACRWETMARRARSRARGRAWYRRGTMRRPSARSRPSAGTIPRCRRPVAHPPPSPRHRSSPDRRHAQTSPFTKNLSSPASWGCPGAAGRNSRDQTLCPAEPNGATRDYQLDRTCPGRPPIGCVVCH